MLPRVLEPEVMDSAEEAKDYDAIDHGGVNRAFAEDFFRFAADPGRILDVGSGTALIPLEMAKLRDDVYIVGIDLAEEMVRLGRDNILRAGMAARILLQTSDAKRIPFGDGSFGSVVSNSIVHHIPEPAFALAEMVRVVRPGGFLFVRDLIRPDSDAEVNALVAKHAEGANDHQRKMLDDSLRAALTLEEIRDVVVQLGFASESVQKTSDRHWTWAARKPI